MQAIRQVLDGRIYVSEKVSARILENVSGHRSGSQSPVERLSDREFEVFQMLGQGQATREIAQHLHLSIKTVEVHRANIRAKARIGQWKRVGPLRNPLERSPKAVTPFGPRFQILQIEARVRFTKICSRFAKKGEFLPRVGKRVTLSIHKLLSID